MFEFSLVYLLITILVLLILKYLFKIWNSYNFFKKLGIKTPEPSFPWGNYHSLKNHTRYSQGLYEWTQKYGKTYGYYEGHTPILVTSDLKIIQQVFIKQSSNFAAKKKFPLQLNDNDPGSSLIIATKNRWKIMRNIMNPTFSNSKMREISPELVKSVDRLMAILEKTEDQEIDILHYMKHFTMDTIWNCAFGVDIDVQNNPNDPYFVKSEKIMDNMSNPLEIFLVYFPEIKDFVRFMLLKVFNKMHTIQVTRWLINKFEELILKKLKDFKDKKEMRTDIVHLLLDAYLKYDDSSENTYQDVTRERNVVKTLDLEEVKANLFLLMIAGYHTTSAALSHCIRMLALYPDEQDKVVDEIKSVLDNVEPNTDNVNELKYLDLFIKEVLRMNLIATPVINRRCTNPTVVENIKMPLDFTVAVDVLTMHFNQDYWGNIDVHEFRPDR
jgi:cytochrome P450